MPESMRGRTPQPLVQGTRESHIKERNEQNEPIANTISAEEIAVADSGGDSDDRAAAHLGLRQQRGHPGE